MNYPKHIYEPIRQEVAVAFVKRELKKILPSIEEGQWPEVGKDIKNWFSDSSTLYPVRDFWNGVHGIMMGFRLIDHLLSFITAENIVWTKESVPPDELVTLAEANSDDVRDGDEPIIVTQKRIEGVDRLVVYDGNNRANKAKAEGRKTVTAYVSRFKGKSRKPENYWLPTSLLMEISHFAKKVYESKDEEKYKCYVSIFSDMLNSSESARYEMKNRVIPTESEYKKRVLSDLGLA